jgi:hypothetical protein
MQAYVFYRILDPDTIKLINENLAINAANCISKAFYKKNEHKSDLIKYFCSIKHHILWYGYYKIGELPNFMHYMRNLSILIHENDDIEFWFKIYMNIQRTLSYEYSCRGKSIIYPYSRNEIEDYNSQFFKNLNIYGNYYYSPYSLF